MFIPSVYTAFIFPERLLITYACLCLYWMGSLHIGAPRSPWHSAAGAGSQQTPRNDSTTSVHHRNLRPSSLAVVTCLERKKKSLYHLKVVTTHPSIHPSIPVDQRSIRRTSRRNTTRVTSLARATYGFNEPNTHRPGAQQHYLFLLRCWSTATVLCWGSIPPRAETTTTMMTSYSLITR